MAVYPRRNNASFLVVHGGGTRHSLSYLIDEEAGDTTQQQP